jgi:hypothetical protein
VGVTYVEQDKKSVYILVSLLGSILVCYAESRNIDDTLGIIHDFKCSSKVCPLHFFKKNTINFLGMRRIEKTKQHPEFFKKNYRRVCKRQKRDNI